MFVSTKDLPAPIRSALSSVGYKRADVEVTTGTEYAMVEGSAMTVGRKGFVVAVNLHSGANQLASGAWGGPNPADRRQVDLDKEYRPLPVGGAVILGERGYKGCFARVRVHPDNLAKLIPATEAITERERGIIASVCGLNSKGRRDEWEMWEVAPSDVEFDALVARGYLTRNKRGAIGKTTKGKNARGGDDDRWGDGAIRAQRKAW